ncbi:hypothetical protein M3Y98_00600200 [Aphelenchoides besseyi]|nr:hypothetical protein M3Y98_00600200 [Aphelenchoides besseyi]KAI6194065.1 hypothetical protein M3Y96_01085300 [Aphelenchoides besseyi]
MANNEQQSPLGPVHCIARRGQTKLSNLMSPNFDGNNRAGNDFLGGRFQSALASSSSKTAMQSSVVFVNEDFELTDFIACYLRDSNDYTVVGGIGLCSSGKSTLMSMLAGNSPRDKYRQYIFRPSASRETIESGFFQTNGLHVYVSSETRAIYIDSKPFNCGAVFANEHVRKAKSDANKSIYKEVQTEDLILLSLLFELCDTVVFCIDWFIDINAIHEVLRASVFSEFNFRKYTTRPKETNLAFVHQRASNYDYEMREVKQRVRMLRTMFSNSRWNVTGGLSMKNLGFTEYEDCDPEVNYVLMDELPQWNKDGLEISKPLAHFYGYVLDRLRPAILSLPKQQFRFALLTIISMIVSRTLNKMRPLRRDRKRDKTLSLPPTLDPKTAAKYRAEHLADKKKAISKNENKDEIETECSGFNPDFMPNITQLQETTQNRETWNEQLALSSMTLPDNESALNSLNLLLTTHTGDDDYIDSLLPVAESPRHSERQFEYAQKVFDITRKAYTTKYFVSNNGRLTPRLVRRLHSSTKLLYNTTVKSSKRKETRTRSSEMSTKMSGSAEQLVAETNDLHVDDASHETSIRDGEEGDRQARSETIVTDEEEEEEEEAESEEPTSEDSDFVLSTSNESSDDEGIKLRSNQSEVDSSDSSDGEKKHETKKREPFQRRRQIASDED